MKGASPKERRKGPDKWIVLTRLASILSWLSFLVALIFFHYARPERNTGIVRYYGIPIREEWLAPWSEWLVVGLFVCALLSVFSLIVGSFRARRKGDNIGYSIILLLLVTLGWLGYFWL